MHFVIHYRTLEVSQLSCCNSMTEFCDVIPTVTAVVLDISTISTSLEISKISTHLEISTRLTGSLFIQRCWLDTGDKV